MSLTNRHPQKLVSIRYNFGDKLYGRHQLDAHSPGANIVGNKNIKQNKHNDQTKESKIQIV